MCCKYYLFSTITETKQSVNIKPNIHEKKAKLFCVYLYKLVVFIEYMSEATTENGEREREKRGWKISPRN